MKAAKEAAVVAARPEDERLGMGANFAYGLQHVLTMYGGIIAVPLIIGGAAGLDQMDIGLLIAAALFMGGAATILQSFGLPFFGSQLPIVQGVSFASVSTMLAILSGAEDGKLGLRIVLGAVIGASVIGFLIAPVFAKIIRFFPPVVTGVVITTIGLSLMPVAGRWVMGSNADSPDWGSVENISMAGLTLLLVLIMSKLGIATLSRLSILLAIVLGTVIASFTGMADLSKVGDGDIIALPNVFHWGLPIFEFGAILSMFVVIIVIMVETTADIIAVGEIIGSKVGSKRIADGLRADMVGSAIAPVFGSFPQSAFAQNVGLVAITGVRSRYVVTAGGVILLVLGLFPIVGRLVAAVPNPVLGGAGIVLFGTVAAAGIRTLAKVKYDGNMNLIIVATSLAFGVLPELMPGIYDAFPSQFQIVFGSGISAAAIMSVLLNLVFNHWTFGNPEQASVFAAGTKRVVSVGDISSLEPGDYFLDGKLVDSSGTELEIEFTDAGMPVDADEISGTPHDDQPGRA